MYNVFIRFNEAKSDYYAQAEVQKLKQKSLRGKCEASSHELIKITLPRWRKDDMYCKNTHKEIQQWIIN